MPKKIEYCCDKLKNSEIVHQEFNFLMGKDGKHYLEYLDTFSIDDDCNSELIDYCPFCGKKIVP